MREILFRGKRTDNGKWVTGLLARYNPKYEIANMVTDFEILVPVYTKTVGQYTDWPIRMATKSLRGILFIVCLNLTVQIWLLFLSVDNFV